MKFFLPLLTFLIFHSAFSQKKAVFIIADGIPADVIERVNTPTLDAIAKEGGYARALVGGEKDHYSQTPTISAVGYNSVITGTWVNKHNVWDNDILSPNYNYWNLFRFLKEQCRSAKIGIFSSWADNRTKLVGEKLNAAGNLSVDYVLDSLEHDSIHFPQDEQRVFMKKIDDSVARHAANVIRTKAPDLSWVYLEYTDDIGHMYGDSPQMDLAVQKMDSQIALIYEAVRFRKKKFDEDWLIIITTDHGRDSITGHNHGGQTSREKSGWIFTNASRRNRHFNGGSLAIVDIMPSIADHLHLAIPRPSAMEIDGVSFINEAFADNFNIIRNANSVTLRWRPFTKGKANVWVSSSNLFKSGGKDIYLLAKEVELSRGTAEIPLTYQPGQFYKVVLEQNGKFLNHWITDSPSSSN